LPLFLRNQLSGSEFLEEGYITRPSPHQLLHLQQKQRTHLPYALVDRAGSELLRHRGGYDLGVIPG
jgi:hypothetical protein